MKIKNENIFLLDNFFFNSIDLVKFKLNYQSFFQYKYFIKNQTIYKENSIINSIYFLEKGEIQLKTTKSYFDIVSILKGIIVDKRTEYLNQKVLNSKIISNLAKNFNDELLKSVVFSVKSLK